MIIARPLCRISVAIAVAALSFTVLMMDGSAQTVEPGRKAAPSVGRNGNFDDSVRPVNPKGGVFDDSIRPVAPQGKAKSGDWDDSVRPANPKGGTFDDSVRPVAPKKSP
jgi:hypothetical protein